MAEQKRNYFEGPAAELRLRELGLEVSWLVDAVRASEIERRSCSPLEPSIAPGFKAWSAAFRRLAEELVPRGWAKTETLNLPRLVNKSTAVAVAVSSGNEATGTSNEPDFKNTRGEVSKLLIRTNQRQLVLFAEMQYVPIPAEEEQKTWWLLIYSDDSGVLRAELGLPIRLGGDAELSMWEQRIVIDIPNLDQPSIPESDEEPPEILVNVRPKS